MNKIRFNSSIYFFNLFNSKLSQISKVSKYQKKLFSTSAKPTERNVTHTPVMLKEIIDLFQEQEPKVLFWLRKQFIQLEILIIGFYYFI